MPGYFSEIRYEGGLTNDFIEVAVPTGTDASAYSVAIYDKSGLYLTSLSLGTVDATIAGTDLYVITPADPGFVDIRHNYTTALVDNTGTVIQLLAHTLPLKLSGGPAHGMTGSPSGVAKTLNTQSIQSEDGGATYSMQAAPNPGVVPCYAPGTLIETEDGPRAVETLRLGDRVWTLDHGPMPIRWLRAGDQPLDGVDADARPVLIRAGALGPGRPARDLIVSPQHRIFAGECQLAGRFARECLVPAKALTVLPGIRFMTGRRRITWHHFALVRHAVVRAEGCLSESLLPGLMVLAGLTGMQRRALAEVLGAAAPGPEMTATPARDCLSVRSAMRRLAADGRQRPPRRFEAA